MNVAAAMSTRITAMETRMVSKVRPSVARALPPIGSRSDLMMAVASAVGIGCNARHAIASFPKERSQLGHTFHGTSMIELQKQHFLVGMRVQLGFSGAGSE
jgi:hypothetical protein